MNLKINENTFPQELIDLDQWLLWNIEKDNGKPIKRPKNTNGKNIDITNTKNLTNYNEAQYLLASEPQKFKGVGFSVLEKNGIVFIDIDKCIDDGVINEKALAVVKDINSYTEVSQSGTGLHIFAKGTKLGDECKTKQNGLEVEMYNKERFSAMTGKHLDGTPLHLNENQAALDRFYKMYVEKPKPLLTVTHVNQDTSDIRQLTAKESKKKMQNNWNYRLNSDNEKDQKTAQKFFDLWHGKWENHASTKSEATQSLLAEILYWCQKDRERVLEVIGEKHKLFDNTNSEGGEKRSTWDKYIELLVYEMNRLLPTTKMYDPDYKNKTAFNLYVADDLNIKLPTRYQIKNKELHIEQEDSGETKSICRHIPFIEAEYIDISTGYVSYKLTYVNHKGKAPKTTIDVQADTIADAQKLIQLSVKGFAVNTNNRKDLITYFDKFLSENTIPKVYSTSRIGHIGNKLIHPLRAQDVHIIPNDDETKRLLNAFKSKGTLEGYVNDVLKPLQDIPIPFFLQIASCASVLLKPLDIEPFVIETSGLTSTGKTAATETAMAVWGEPNELMIGWNATKPSIDRMTQFLNSYPLMIDDTKKAENFEKISDVIYTHSDGRSKAKASGSNDLVMSNTWRNILFSTGEQSVVDTLHEHGGVGPRTITLEETPFPNGYDYHTHFKRLKANYGTLGLAFIEQYESKQKYYHELFNILEQRYIKLAKNNDVWVRLARIFSVIHLSGYILGDIHNSISIDKINKTMKHIYKNSVTESKGTDNPKRKLSLLLEEIEGLQSKIHYRTGQIPRNGDFIAYVKDDYIGIVPHFMNKTHIFGKGELEKLLPVWKERGYTTTDEGRNRKRTTVTFGNMTTGDNQTSRLNLIAINRHICEDLGYFFKEPQESPINY